MQSAWLKELGISRLISGPRMLASRFLDRAVFLRELLPQDLQVEIEQLTHTVNLSHPRVLQMVTDSLRYWALEMHVEGFRFDLATILAREPWGDGAASLHCRPK
jgi:hypothetical protein